ncbi:uncharacterized protein TNIN_340331 [Trichonephila inaurata madagascariensis]|uniref:Pre-C2HC domain-containing protein n=1 Tax=Trichonephila inaurata madagascariensis TaxID=2747483 RepID=A0A8X7C5R8_9ARAC|nr:uncharacterized protein TNIN_340331 [Trichonephila inaurata madagascariensis]
MFRHKKENYRSIVKDLNKDFPNCDVKLSGEYFKIYTSNSEEHRTLTAYLDEKSEEFYVIQPLNARPLKSVIKGLPTSTEIGEIKDDLTAQGFNVEKVAQLTIAKTKSPLPIFLVELKKSPNSPDIFQLKKCCYLSVKVDNLNRRPEVTQCYICNLFNHSSKNCHMRTRCLKCGEPHKTIDCPIKDKIENPKCINYNKLGHIRPTGAIAKNSPSQKRKKAKPYLTATPTF